MICDKIFSKGSSGSNFLVTASNISAISKPFHFTLPYHIRFVLEAVVQTNKPVGVNRHLSA